MADDTDCMELLDFAGPKEIFGNGQRLVHTTLVTTAEPGWVRTADDIVMDVAHGWAPHQADIIERELGAQAASAIEAGTEYERRGTVWR